MENLKPAMVAVIVLALVAGIVASAHAQQAPQVVRQRIVLQQSGGEDEEPQQSGLDEHLPQGEFEVESEFEIDAELFSEQLNFYHSMKMTPVYDAASPDNAYDLNGNGIADDPIPYGGGQVFNAHVQTAHSMLKGSLESGIRTVEIEGEPGVEYRAVIDNVIREIDEAEAEVEAATEEAVETEESGE